MNLDLQNLEKSPEGFWIPKAQSDNPVHYPDEGHETPLDFEQKSFWYVHRNNCIVSMINNLPPADSKPMVDLGGGSGFVAKGIEDSGTEVILLEPKNNGAKKGVQRGLKNVICAQFEDCGFDKNSIGAIGLFDVVEHIEKDVAFIDMLHDYLAPGGRIYVTVPAHMWLWSAEDIIAQHFRRYTMESLKGIFASDKFEIDFASYFFQWLTLPIFALRAIPFRLQFYKSAEDYKPNLDHHDAGGGAVDKMLESIHKKEVAHVKNGSPMSWGASLLLTARKL